jgi:hypothetical protein
MSDHKSYNQARLHLVRKKAGATGKNLDKLEDDKIYVAKKIIKADRESWTYRQSKVLGLMTSHPNIITLHGLIMPSKEKAAEGR